jgi:hypothetical protein
MLPLHFSILIAGNLVLRTDNAGAKQRVTRETPLEVAHGALPPEKVERSAM